MHPRTKPFIRLYAALCAATLVLPAVAAQDVTQEAKPVAAATLERARRTFQAADRNADGRIERAELELARVKVTAVEFAARDLDGNTYWSRDEFVLWYRGLLIANRQRPAADLETEATRILAIQRTRPVTPANPVAPAAAPVDQEARLGRALEDLERKALARGATREDFTAVRTMWEERLAATQPQTPPEELALLKAKVARALADLETRAAEGKVTREEFTQLRQALLTRARAAAPQETAQKETGQQPAQEAAPATPALEARFAQALEDLETKALARQATREQFAAVREQLVARARRAAKEGAANDTTIIEAQTQALERLETRALAGQVTREDFVAFRGLLAGRTRAQPEQPRADAPARTRADQPKPQARDAKPAPANGRGKD
jgi:hypothetical protein